MTRDPAHKRHGLWTTGKKTTAAFMTMIGIVFLVSIGGYLAVQILQAELQNLGEKRIPDLRALSTLNQQRMAIRGDVFAIALLQHQNASPEAYDAIRQHQQESWKQIDAAWTDLLAIPRQSQRGKELMEETVVAYGAWREIHRKMDQVVRELVHTRDRDQNEKLHARYTALIREALPLSNAVTLIFDALTDNNIANTSAMTQKNRNITRILHGSALLSTFLGTALGIFLFFLTQKARKHAAEKRWQEYLTLEKRRANLQAIFETMPTGMVLLNERGEVCRTNPVIGKMLQKDLSPFLFMQPGDVLHCIHALETEKGCGYADTVHCSQCRIRAVFECVLEGKKEIRDVEARHRLLVQGKEETFFFNISAAPLFLDEREHVLISLADITALKTAEAELRSSNALLQKAIVQTNLLAQKAEAASLAKSTFLANMHHEIRTPMNTVLGFTELCLTTELSTEQEDYLKKVYLAGSTLMNLLNDLLDLAALDRQPSPHQPEENGSSPSAPAWKRVSE